MKLKALTAAVLAAALLSACGSSAASSAAPAADTSSETAASADNSGDLLAQIQQRGEIVFGTEGTWSPWTYHDENDQLVGFDIEVAQKVAEKLGVKATFVEGEWDGLLAGVDDLNQTIELLLNGRVDATLNAEVTYFDYLKEHPDANIKIAALTNDASQVAFPVRKGDETATLREALNQAINELREDGTIAEISEKYFGTDLSQAPSAN